MYDAKYIFTRTYIDIIFVVCELVAYHSCSVDDLKEGYMQALAMVGYKGDVFWPPIVKYRGNCEIIIKYFPFDDQVRDVCHFTKVLTPPSVIILWDSSRFNRESCMENGLKSTHE